MKEILRTLFSPILTPFESGDAPYSYKKSHRVIMIVIGILFSGLATAVLLVAPKEDFGFLIPVIAFYGVAIVAITVGSLGSDRAVAKVWGSKN